MAPSPVSFACSQCGATFANALALREYLHQHGLVAKTDLQSPSGSRPRFAAVPLELAPRPPAVSSDENETTSPNARANDHPERPYSGVSSAARWFEGLGNRTLWLPLGGVLALAALLRFWQIGSRPEWEWDEVSYAYIAHNLAAHGLLQAKPEYGMHGTAFLYQPPFYFTALAAWFKIVGSGVTQARIWAVIMSLLALVMLFYFLRKLIGQTGALGVVAFLAVDSWLAYANRIGWIENTLMVLVIGALWLYNRAFIRSTTISFVLAGLAIGAAVVFKHTGLYVLAAVLVNWLICRRYKKEHLWLLASTAAVVITYAGVMSLLYPHVFWSDMHIQLVRSFGSSSTGRQGAIQNLGDLVRPLLGPYRLFAGTLLLSVIGGVVWAVRVVQCIWKRSWAPVKDNSLLFAWMTAAVIGFGIIRLRYPNYFEVILIPTYAYLAAEVIARLRTSDSIRRRQVYVLGAAVIVALGITGFGWRIMGYSANPLKEVGQYATIHIPRTDMVIADEPVGMAIPQPYSYIQILPGFAASAADYVITYESDTYKIPRYPTLRMLLRDSTRLKVLSGFKEKITVWRINKPR